MSETSLENVYVAEAGIGDPETGTLLRLDCPPVLIYHWQRNRWPPVVPTPATTV